MQSKENKLLKILRVFLGLVIGIFSLANIKVLLEFPMGVVFTIELIFSDKEGNMGAVLGELAGDGVIFVVTLLLIYISYRLIRGPKASKLIADNEESPA